MSDFSNVDFRYFKKEITRIAKQEGYCLIRFEESGLTPNFHMGLLEKDTERISVLCNNRYPMIAFAEEYENGICQLQFRDSADLAIATRRNTEFQILETSDLNSPISESELSNLNESEIRQIKYWKSQTIGEIIYNWWD